MLMFTFHIAFALMLAVFGGGALLWHTASRSGGSVVLRIAAVVLVLGSVLSVACMTYFGKKYREEGAFDSAYPTMRPMGMRGMNMMRPGMMGPGMMRRDNRGGPSPMGPMNPSQQAPFKPGAEPAQDEPKP